MNRFRVPKPAFHWYGNKGVFRIGGLVIDLGWYSGELPIQIEARFLTVDRSIQMVTVMCVQVSKLALCVSYDWA